MPLLPASASQARVGHATLRGMQDTSGEGVCRLCGAAEVRVIYAAVPAISSKAPSRFDVCECTACGFVQTTPLPSAEELRETYEAASYTWKAGTSVVARFESFYRKALVRADQVRSLRWACERAVVESLRFSRLRWAVTRSERAEMIFCGRLELSSSAKTWLAVTLSPSVTFILPIRPVVCQLTVVVWLERTVPVAPTVAVRSPMASFSV